MVASRLTLTFNGKNIIVNSHGTEVEDANGNKTGTLYVTADGTLTYDYASFLASKLNQVTDTHSTETTNDKIYVVLADVLKQSNGDYSQISVSNESSGTSIDNKKAEIAKEQIRNIKYSDLDKVSDKTYDYKISFRDYYVNSINLARFRAQLIQFPEIKVDDELYIDNNCVIHMYIRWTELSETEFDDIMNYLNSLKTGDDNKDIESLKKWYPYKLGQNIDDMIKDRAEKGWYYINIYGNAKQDEKDIFENFMLELANKEYIITYHKSDIDEDYFMWQANICWNVDSHAWVLNAIPKTNPSQLTDINYFYECVKDMLTTGNTGYNNVVSITNKYQDSIMTAKEAKYLALKKYDVEQELPDDLMSIIITLNNKIEELADIGKYEITDYSVDCTDAEADAIASYYKNIGYNVNIEYMDENTVEFDISWK